MADNERDTRRQSQTLRELIDHLGHLPLSELTPEQKWLLHDATDGFFKPSDRLEPATDARRSQDTIRILGDSPDSIG
jgi:hypothetical protein